MWHSSVEKVVKDKKKEKKKTIFNVSKVEWSLPRGVLESVCQRAVISRQWSPASSSQDLDSEQKKNCPVLCVQSPSLLFWRVSCQLLTLIVSFCFVLLFHLHISLFLFLSSHVAKTTHKFQTILFVKVSRLDVFVLRKVLYRSSPRPPLPFFFQCHPTSSDLPPTQWLTAKNLLWINEMIKKKTLKE